MAARGKGAEGAASTDETLAAIRDALDDIRAAVSALLQAADKPRSRKGRL